MAKDYTQVNFRIPTDLKERIEKSAIDNDRSITADLVSRLEGSFQKNDAEQEQINTLTIKVDKLQATIDILINKIENC